MKRLDKPDMTVGDAVVAMAGGNIGALQVVLRMAEYDPLGLLMLDDWGIYGDDIWYAYGDVNDGNYDKLMDSIQTGELPGKLEALKASWGA